MCVCFTGGLMVCLPKDKAAAFCKEIEVSFHQHATKTQPNSHFFIHCVQEIDGYPAWIIGDVVEGKNFHISCTGEA